MSSNLIVNNIEVGAGATIYTAASNQLAFGTNGSERLRIDSSGRLLLGTATEGHAEGDNLTVSSSSITGITVRSGTSSPGNIFFSDGTSGNAERMGIIRYDHNGNYMMFGVNYGEKLRITSTGQVAIGTDTAETGYILTMAGDLSLGEKGGVSNTYIDQKQDGDLHLINSGRTANGASGSPGTAGVGINRYNNISGGTSLFRDFAVYNGKNSKVLVVDGSASAVGIGTDSPEALLHVSKLNGAAEIVVRSSTQPRLMLKTTGTTAECRVDFGDSGDSSRGAIGYNHDDDALKFYTSGVANERLRIDSSGRTLLNNLGNATPGLSGNADDLVIAYGSQSAETGITMYSTTASSIRFNDNSGTDGAIEYGHASRQMIFNAANANRLTFGINAANSPVFNMGVSSGDANNHNKADRASVKVGDYLSIESPTGTGHNARAGLGYNCYFHSLETFYCGTNSPNSGDNRPAAYGMAYGNHYFYGDASNTAHSPQQQLTMTRNMVIHRQGYVTKPAHPTFCARYKSGSSFSNGGSGDILLLTKVDGDFLTWNNGGYYSTSTGKFTAPVAGFYYFEGQVMATGFSNNTNIQDMVQLRSNQGLISHPRQRRTYFRTEDDANGYYVNGAAGQAKLAAGDTVWFQRNGGGSWSYSNTNYTYFTGWLIG